MYYFSEVQAAYKPITIIRSTIEEKVSHTRLTNLQRFICKLFKIEPAFQYTYKIKAFVQDMAYFNKGDIVRDEYDCTWYVGMVKDDSLQLLSYKALSDPYGRIGNQLLLVARPISA